MSTQSLIRRKSLIVKKLEVCGLIRTNAYFYIDETTKHGFLIDPGAEPDKILSDIKENQLSIDKILITHGHFDHIGAVAEVSKILGIPYYAHQNAKQYLTDGAYNLSSYFGEGIKLSEACYFEENDEFSLSDNLSLKVVYTPGHTLDSVVFYDKKNGIAFVGDTIFKGSVGRTDVPGGDFQTLQTSIKNKILALPDETILYSGHSDSTTVGAEKAWF